MATNQVTIIGEIVTKPKYSHAMFGEKFYTVELLVERLSEAVDVLPIMFSEKQICAEEDYRCERVSIVGELRSFHYREGHKRHLQLHVLAKEIQFLERRETEINTNEIFLDGYLCKDPLYRTTPTGKEISELMLAVNRKNGREDYIPCICWGSTARYMRYASQGEHIRISGRFQSREYFTRDEERRKTYNMTYEVSINRLW